MLKSQEKVVASGIFPWDIDRGGPLDERSPEKEEVQICRKFIQLFGKKIQRIQKKTSSYGLKHDVENWTAELPNKGPYKQVDLNLRKWESPKHYISNGAFIQAMLLEGFSCVRCDPGSMNAYFNASWK